MRVALLGVGLIGGSIGAALRQRLPGADVTGFDPGAGVLHRARAVGAVDRAAATVAEAVAGAETCFPTWPPKPWRPRGPTAW